MTSYEELIEKVHPTHGLPWEVPGHVIRRLDALLVGESVEFTDAVIDKGNDGYTGAVFVLTKDRVLYALFTDALSPHEGPQGGETSTTTVESWSRRRLRSVTMPSGIGRNTDRAWGEDSGDQWPFGARLALAYEGRDPIIIPMAKEYPKQQIAPSGDSGNHRSPLG